MIRCSRIAVAVVLMSVAAVLPAASATGKAAAAHKLVVAVAKNLPPVAQRKLAVLVLVTQNGGPPSAAVATARRPLTIHLDNRGFYRVKAEIDASCKGTCAASYRISGAADHKLMVVPSCRLKGSVFVCSKLTIARVY